MDNYTDAIVYLSNKKMSCIERLMSKKLLLIEQNLLHSKLTSELIAITKKIDENEAILDNLKQAEEIEETIKSSHKSNKILNTLIGLIIGVVSFFVASSFSTLLINKLFLTIVAALTTISIEKLVDDFKYHYQTKELKNYQNNYSYNDIYIENRELERDKKQVLNSLKHLKENRLTTTKSIRTLSEVISIITEHIVFIKQAKDETILNLGENVNSEELNKAFNEDYEVRRILEKERKKDNDN